MCWNDGYERRKFEARQKKQAEEYRALGMTEEQIKEMYEFDLEQYKEFTLLAHDLPGYEGQEDKYPFKAVGHYPLFAGPGRDYFWLDLFGF